MPKAQACTFVVSLTFSGVENETPETEIATRKSISKTADFWGVHGAEGRFGMGLHNLLLPL